MDVTRNFFVRADAGFRQKGRVKRKPLRQPVGGKTGGIGSEDEVEANGARRHDLLPFGDFEMRLGGADNGDHNRCAGEARPLHVLLLKVEFGILLERDPECRLSEAHTLLAAIHNETPGSELAMVGNAHGKAQHVLDLRRRGSRFGKLQGRRGAANLEVIEELDIAGHDQKLSILLSLRKHGP
ncbi:hypothetical protein AT6N2_C0523 [Agrobacterium tumefaciens]|nr:hypothetical protein AT6N2_C0523 [Agrobacterium tumefaciens]